ncbi:PQQ-dependent sugar dehydrogenase [Pseudoxanthomonas taiwanensis]|uniref:Glucose/arabinose dehydrogenase n=1 Tax=Pseudoxanthomonas taiwanensis J19 TaxID=935569 RepID=A0A562DHI2_9GAMM|nr:PQQ-dependent sugar dehydrogenase [Pseudoxanthomonas taiwanensis]TWH09033.1 glucose/arabinose dehydrogenase [Pseudoxanthomonas taiwanensis J19]
MKSTRIPLALAATLGLLASAPVALVAPAQARVALANAPFAVAEVQRFDSPWAMTFLPDGRLLVTEMAGNLRLFDPASGKLGTVAGVPKVAHGGQGGLADVVLHPAFAGNQLVYISYSEAGEGGTAGAAVARARLVLDQDGGGRLDGLQVIWRQQPKVSGQGHFGQRIAFDRDGKLWISSSERQKFDPAQDMKTNLGKMIRLDDDGSVPADNPFADQGGVAAQVWTLGHRNILGVAFDGEGRLWAHEMGPKGGDELNLIERGDNYGYPVVSNGDHYDGKPIPDHDTRPEFHAPAVSWNPVISPAGFVIYSGDRYPGWKGSGLIGGLSSKSLVRIAFDGTDAREAERFDMGRRIREVEQGPDGTIWLLEDGTRDGQGWLLRLDPKS